MSAPKTVDLRDYLIFAQAYLKMREIFSGQIVIGSTGDYSKEGSSWTESGVKEFLQGNYKPPTIPKYFDFEPTLTLNHSGTGGNYTGGLYNVSGNLLRGYAFDQDGQKHNLVKVGLNEYENFYELMVKNAQPADFQKSYDTRNVNIYRSEAQVPQIVALKQHYPAKQWSWLNDDYNNGPQAYVWTEKSENSGVARIELMPGAAIVLGPGNEYDANAGAGSSNDFTFQPGSDNTKFTLKTTSSTTVTDKTTKTVQNGIKLNTEITISSALGVKDVNLFTKQFKQAFEKATTWTTSQEKTTAYSTSVDLSIELSPNKISEKDFLGKNKAGELVYRYAVGSIKGSDGTETPTEPHALVGGYKYKAALVITQAELHTALQGQAYTTGAVPSSAIVTQFLNFGSKDDQVIRHTSGNKTAGQLFAAAQEFAKLGEPYYGGANYVDQALGNEWIEIYDDKAVKTSSRHISVDPNDPKQLILTNVGLRDLSVGYKSSVGIYAIEGSSPDSKVVTLKGPDTLVAAAPAELATTPGVYYLGTAAGQIINGSTQGKDYIEAGPSSTINLSPGSIVKLAGGSNTVTLKYGKELGADRLTTIYGSDDFGAINKIVTQGYASIIAGQGTNEITINGVNNYVKKNDYSISTTYNPNKFIIEAGSEMHLSNYVYGYDSIIFDRANLSLNDYTNSHRSLDLKTPLSSVSVQNLDFASSGIDPDKKASALFTFLATNADKLSGIAILQTLAAYKRAQDNNAFVDNYLTSQDMLALGEKVLTPFEYLAKISKSPDPIATIRNDIIDWLKISFPVTGSSRQLASENSFYLLGNNLATDTKFQSAIKAMQDLSQNGPLKSDATGKALLKSIEAMDRKVSDQLLEDIYNVLDDAVNLIELPPLLGAVPGAIEEKSTYPAKYLTIHNAIFVQDLYNDLLGRFPTQSEVNENSRQLDGKQLTRSEFVANVLKSSEFIAKYPDSSSYVKEIVVDVLGGASNDPGIALWTSALNNGMKKATFVDYLAASDTFIQLVGVSNELAAAPAAPAAPAA